MSVLDKLFRNQRGKPPTEEPETQAPIQMPPEEAPKTEPSLQEEAMFPPFEGDMLALWKRWAPEAPAPTLTLFRGRDPETMPLDRTAVIRERMRLSCKLEQEAKVRAAQLLAAENLGEEPRIDAECKCFVTRDNMVAWLFAFPPVGSGKKLTGGGVAATMEKSKVLTKIDSNAIVEILAGRWFELIPVAIGTPPVEGKDGRIIEHFPREVEHTIRLDPDGRADYRAQSYIQVVHEGDVICDIEMPQRGTSGMRVDGVEVPAKKVTAAPVPKGRGTKFSEDGLSLLAEVTGNLGYFEGAFHVMEVLEIPGDIDYSSGNIDFPGDVHIFGDVREGFKVKAQGGIFVDGLVESATVEAGTDIVIGRGVVGDSRAVLRCSGDLRAKYLESCTVYAGKCVYADCIVTADIFCGDTISVTSGRGSVIGGNLTAARGIKAQTIGARSGRITQIELGVSAYLEQEIDEIRGALDQLGPEKEQAEMEILSLERHGDNPRGKAQLAKARLKRSTLEMKETQYLKRLQRLTEQRPDLKQCVIECNTIYPITKVVIDGYAETIESIGQGYLARYDEQTGGLKECIQGP